jgi:hypothetical protein
MRSLFIISAMLASRLLQPVEPLSKFINPTGTYTLMGTVKKNQVISHSGEIRVELLDSSRVAICFYMNRGYPGYQSGSFIDTLLYDDNEAKYTPQTDTNCSIILKFTPKAVEIMALYSDPQCSCGFADGVITAAVFEKSSEDKPVIQDLAVRRIPDFNK